MDKRKALDSIFAKLAKLLPLLGSDKPGEADNARLAINRELAKAKLDWHDVVTLLGDSKPDILEMLARLFEKEADTLVRLGFAGAKFFVIEGGQSGLRAVGADIGSNGHRSTLSLSSSEFSDWLIHQFYAETKKAPAEASLKKACATFAAHARYEGDRHKVHLRVAERAGKIYLDLGDEQWNAVEVDHDGWRVLANAPVRFRRTPSMAPLPIPQSGGSLAELRALASNLSDRDYVLYVAWLVHAFRSGWPHSVLYLSGEEGSTKTTLAKVARQLNDPVHGNLELSMLPGTARDLFVGVSGGHMVAHDNISTISARISDALCQIASGTGFSTRKLYTDTERILIGGSRPVVLTGLTNAITRSDLADRTMVIHLPPIGKWRVTEAEFWTRFEQQRPLILGALLDAVALGLRNLEQVRLARLPRMADFARFSVACEQAFAPPGAFLDAFEASAAEANAVVIENRPVALAVAALMTQHTEWHGTAAELLRELTVKDRAEARPSEWREWPDNPTALAKQLYGDAAALRKIGIEVIRGKRDSDHTRTRKITLRKIVETSDTSDRSDTLDTKSSFQDHESHDTPSDTRSHTRSVSVRPV